MNKKMMLTEKEKARFCAWVVDHVDERVVPQDENNGPALIFNLVHLIAGDGEQYEYKPHQNAELARMGLDMDPAEY